MPSRLPFSKVDVMKTQIQNKMYIVSGGLEPDDVLSCFRFFTKQGLSRVPAMHMQKINDIALEVDLTGLNIEFTKCDCDPYWTCDSNLKLTDVKIARVAYIDRKWRTVPTDDPIDDGYRFVEGLGYRDCLGYGAGWFSKDCIPTYRELVYKYFSPMTYSGRNRYPEYDPTTDKYAGIIGDYRHDRILIYNGTSHFNIEKIVGTIRVEDETVVINMHDQTYRFHSHTDEDFIRWVTMCVKGYHAEYQKYPQDNCSNRFSSDNRLAIKTDKMFAEELSKGPFDMQKFLDERVETQVRHAQYTFRLCMRPYLGKPESSPI